MRRTFSTGTACVACVVAFCCSFGGFYAFGDTLADVVMANNTVFTISQDATPNEAVKEDIEEIIEVKQDTLPECKKNNDGCNGCNKGSCNPYCNNGYCRTNSAKGCFNGNCYSGCGKCQNFCGPAFGCKSYAHWDYKPMQPARNVIRFFHNKRPVRRAMARVGGIFFGRCR